VIGSNQHLSNPDLNRHAQPSRHLVLVRLRLFLTRALCKLAMAVLLAATLLATSQQVVTSPSLIPPKDVPEFEDVTGKLGIHFQHQASPTSKKYLLETMGSGVALFDYDNDGRLDIFLGNGARIDDPTRKNTIPQKDGQKYWNRLYHQKVDGTFEDVTETARLTGTGYSTGVAVADYDNDGHEDIFVAGFGRNSLYHNNGDGTFTDVTDKAGVAGGGWSTSAAWVDYDRDGRLDLVVARYMEWTFNDIYCGEHREGYRSYCHPDTFKPIAPLLYHNDGKGKFTLVSQKAALEKPGKGLGVAVCDFDRDGWPDIMIANDAMPEFLFHNKGDGTFEEIGLVSGMSVDSSGAAFSGMGIDCSDYNNDGWPDVVITDLANQRYALFSNQRDGTFDYATSSSELGVISQFHSGWGVRFLDYDNDGWKDLFIVQSHVMDTIEASEPHLRYRESPLLLHNAMGRRFLNVSDLAGDVFQQKWAARAMAIGDLNNDGKIDAVVSSSDGPAWVLFNRTQTTNHWIEFKLQGVQSNRDGIGAIVRITTSQGDQYASVTTGGSYQSSSDPRVHFGIGTDVKLTAVKIQWPSGVVQLLQNVSADQILVVKEAALTTKIG
jgi:enediyne biosynthesis protein E4